MIRKLIATSFATLILVLFPLLSFSQQLMTTKQRNYPSQEAITNGGKLATLINILDLLYLEDVDIEKITDSAINNILSELDPHSSYLTTEEMKQSMEMFGGNFEGIGIEFNVLNDTLIVVNTIRGGPSEKVGLKSGDRIIKVDTTSVIGISKTDVPKYLRGDKGTEVVLTVVRRGVEGELQFLIVRDKIPIESRDAAYMIAPNSAYIKLNRFMSTTTYEFTSALDSLGAKNDIKGLILDLRGNGGGQLDQAVMLSSQFLPEGSLVVYTEGKSSDRSDLNALSIGKFIDKPLVVLVDEESASASEIVSGAIQDWDRGTIIGRPTFGKGLVQRQIPLADTSALQITVARYHTPSGRFIQRPYEMGNQEDYYLNFAKRYSSGELIHPDSVFKDIADSLKYKTLIKGRTVYGGGGINPDILVPIDTTLTSKYWSQVIGKSIINDYVADYYDKNSEKLRRKYDTFEKFFNLYSVDETIYTDLKDKATELEIVESEEGEADKLKDFIMLQLKALIAQKLWSTSEYFEVINSGSDNLMIQKAIEEIQRLINSGD
ncbi:MAG: S41 family peptidase [Rikenellaceae bacterium]